MMFLFKRKYIIILDFINIYVFLKDCLYFFLFHSFTNFLFKHNSSKAKINIFKNRSNLDSSPILIASLVHESITQVH